MWQDPFDFDFFEFSSFLIERNHIGKLHTELTVPQTGSYVEINVCVDIWVHTYGDMGF